MIKRIRVVTGDAHGGSDDPTFVSWWRRDLAVPAAAPPGTRPARIVACAVIAELSDDAGLAGIGIEWFDDPDHLHRYERWRLGSEGEAGAGAVPSAAVSVVVADEIVVRGADWLESRWRRGGQVLKQMALATRAPGLTQAEFGQRWRARAGTLSTADGRSVPIPETAKGRAYVQNHPQPHPGAGWAYDAVNEVYFDDLDALRARVDWFAANLTGGAESDLVDRSTFVALIEEVLL